MCLRTRRNRLSRRHCRTRNTKNGPKEDTSSSAEQYHDATPQKFKTQATPFSLLLGNTLTSRKELRHLRKGTASCDEIPRTLATLSRMDQIPIHYPYRSHQLAILESAKEPKPENGAVARRLT